MTLIAILAGVWLLGALLVPTLSIKANRDERRQRQILEAQVEAQQRISMITHANLQAVRDQAKRSR